MKTDTTHLAHTHPDAESGCPEYLCSGVLVMTAAAQVPEEVIEYVVDLVDCDYGDSPIDWQRVFDDRLDNSEALLADGRLLLLGNEYDSPAMRKIQREVRKRRRAS